MFKSLRYRINSITIGLKNLWKWRRAIYCDRDFDHWFIYQILKTKLEFQAEHLIKHGHHENSEKYASQIMKVVELIDDVQNEKYIDEVLHDEKWDTARFDEAEVKHSNARKELFKILEENIEYWWD